MRSAYFYLTYIRSLFELIKKTWTRDYQDVRLILEQSGDLKYFNISASIQRYFARGFIVSGLTLTALILMLSVSTLVLGISRARLEHSHEEVYRALLSSAS